MSGSSQCAQIRPELGVYVLGAIAPADRARVRWHLASCPRCREEVAGLAQLYQATKDSGLLRSAEAIGRATISHLTIGGVLHEPCRGTTCGNSTGGAAESFKGIFVRDLKVLAVTARTSQFSSFFEKQARSIEAHDTNRYHQLGLLWAGPIIDLTSYSQASAEDALVAVLK